MAEKSPRAADSLRLAVDVVAAYVSHNKVAVAELPALLFNVHECIRALIAGSPVAGSGEEPAVPVNKSITRDNIICLEDGAKLRTLKRYIRTHHNLSPEEYRAKWNLPADYPMTAPAYSEQRSRLAKKFGLGRIKLAPRKPNSPRRKAKKLRNKKHAKS